MTGTTRTRQDAARSTAKLRKSAPTCCGGSGAFTSASPRVGLSAWTVTPAEASRFITTSIQFPLRTGQRRVTVPVPAACPVQFSAVAEPAAPRCREIAGYLTGRPDGHEDGRTWSRCGDTDLDLARPPAEASPRAVHGGRIAGQRVARGGVRGGASGQIAALPRLIRPGQHPGAAEKDGRKQDQDRSGNQRHEAASGPAFPDPGRFLARQRGRVAHAGPAPREISAAVAVLLA